MKKILQGALVLFTFALAVLLFQISCRKQVLAEPTGAQMNKILYFLGVPPSVGPNELWMANYDGTNPTKINIVLPANITVGGEQGLSLSPDGKTIFFIGREQIGFVTKHHVYRCKVDGSNAERIIEGKETSRALYYIRGAH
ncbi:MAG: hypothetical protein IBJ16_07735 [Chitinophagaceae bacterium]|nr:hypothetical protein [Chitinophagaceae bacterium]